MIQSRKWEFRVSCQLELGESVHVTGSCGVLGEWDPQNLFPLTAEDFDPFSNSSEVVWFGSADIPLEEVHFRFVICKSLKSAGGILYSIRRWETNLHPRIIPACVSNIDNPEVLDFGYIGEYKKVDDGWLVKDSILYLRLCKAIPNAENPVTIWKKKYKGKPCYMKVTPIDISKNTSVDSFLEFHAEESTEVDLADLRSKSKKHMPIVDVSVLKENLTQFRPQEQFGVQCMDEDYIVFRSNLADMVNIGFLVDFYCLMSEGELPLFIGSSILLPSSFQDTYGSSRVPITSPKHTPIGQLSVSYMVVHPLDDVSCKMNVSYARYWKDSWKGLEVGHRGAGNSYHSQPKNCANIRENTIASLKHAFDNGADMVEFDVQLSKDFVPVIYHDFHAIIALKLKKEPLKTDLVEIPIKDLTLSQLHALKLYHKTENGKSRFSDEDFEDHHPFPTLERALQGVPVSCGFNIEIKWTMRYKDGTYELYHPFELNRFLDRILKVVLENQTPRKIIFSCFHPDICSMIRLKQNLYPVLFLTQGEDHTYQDYDDYRTRTIGRAIHFASSANILGINVNVGDILSNSSHIQNAVDHNLVVFCWGDQNSDSDTINHLKEIGLHGIIYDNIDIYNTKKSKKGSVFFCDDKETCRCFPSSCRVDKDKDLPASPDAASPSSMKRSESDESEAGSPKRIRTDMSDDTHNGGQKSPSFCGILTSESKLVTTN